MSIAKKFRYKVLFPLLALLPQSVGYRIVARIGRRDAYHHPWCESVRQGFRTFFADANKGEEEINEMTIKHFQMLARDTLDCYLMPRFSPSNTRNLLKVHNLEALTEAQEAGKGVIMIISHYGRFFMLGPGMNFLDVKFGMLTTVVDERHPTYDAVDRWYMAKKMRNALALTRGPWVTTADDPRQVYRCLKRGEIVLIALDGNETNSPGRVSFPFNGGTLSFPEGIVRIAKATGAKLVYSVSQDTDPGVEITFHSLPDDPLSALEKTVKLLEKDMLETPWQWWLWPALGAFWQAGEKSKEGVG